MAHIPAAKKISAGLRGLPCTAASFAATQAAWRFFCNLRLTLLHLIAPLILAARDGVRESCEKRVLIMLDWTRLDYGDHNSKRDRIVLQNRHDLGYKLLTALAISDHDGEPLAPVCLELKSKARLHTTRSETVQRPRSALDELNPVLEHVAKLGLGKPPVFVIDREADSIEHFRRWDLNAHIFLVRAKDNPHVLHGGISQSVKDVAVKLVFAPARIVKFKDVEKQQYVGSATVVIERPASMHRTRKGKRVKTLKPGKPLTLRLVVSEIRNASGEVLSQWLLLTNDMETEAATVALWYYWRWRIESYHKLLKSAGQEIESWQQEDATAISRRLLVSAMACVLIWRLARDESAEAAELREVLVSLSGRQMKRGKGRRRFTEPALLAGLGVLLPMLLLLEQYTLDDLKKLVRKVLPPDWVKDV